MARMTICLIVVIACLISPVGLIAQENLRTTVAARSGAINAGTADGQLTSDALLWNPAGLVGNKSASLSFTHYNAFQEFSYDQLEGYYPKWKNGYWGGRLLIGRSAPFTEFDQTGRAINEITLEDSLMHIGVGFPFGQHLSFGLAGKVNYRSLANYNNLSSSLDLGLAWQWPGQPFRIGASLHHLGFYSALREETGMLPGQWRTGLSYRYALASSHYVTAIVDMYQDLNLVGSVNTAMGVEYNLADLMFIRGSMTLENDEPVYALGGGFQWLSVGLDYAYQTAHDLGAHHRFALSYSFSQNKQAFYEPTIKQPILETYHRRDLRAAPRQLHSLVTNNYSAIMPKVKQWRFDIITWDGRVVRTYRGKRELPGYLRWDGKNNQGKVVDDTNRYKTRLYGDNRLIVDRPLLAFKPVVKLKFNQPVAQTYRTMFEPEYRIESKAWELSIIQRSNSKVIKKISGRGLLPKQIIWDGRRQDNSIADQRLAYSYELLVLYKDDTYARLNKTINAIEANLQPEPNGRTAIAIKGILFDFNSAVIKPAFMDKISAAIQTVKLEPQSYKVICEGHADEIGTRDYNFILSKARAEMVARYILKKTGIQPTAILSKGYGYDRPIRRGQSKQTRYQNRRVEIKLQLIGKN